VPVCSPAYLQRMKQKTGEDRASNSVILFEGSNNDWLKSFQDKLNLNNRTKHMRFPDYAVVIQTALLGQGIAPGWLNVSSFWLRSGELVPAAFPAIHRGRYCQLLCRRDKPLRSVVTDVRDWIVESMNTDIAALDRMYPDLIPASLKQI
jgi:LysR family transcriptional regulator, glycine cleavage system transcriptional activator